LIIPGGAVGGSTMPAFAKRWTKHAARRKTSS
jgi:hypothetical protein